MRKVRPVRARQFPSAAAEQASAAASENPSDSPAPAKRAPVTMVNFAAVHTEAVKAIDAHYLPCRTLGHSWSYDSITKQGGNGEPVQHRQELTCSRCPVTKTQVLNTRGEIVSSNYWYPSDYKFTAAGGPNRHDRAAMRMRVVKSSRRFV